MNEETTTGAPQARPKSALRQGFFDARLNALMTQGPITMEIIVGNQLTMGDRYWMGQTSPGRHWDWVVRTNSLIAAFIEDDGDGHATVIFPRQVERKTGLIEIQRWANDMLAFRHGLLPPGAVKCSRVTLSFTDEPTPACILCTCHKSDPHVPAIVSYLPSPFIVQVKGADGAERGLVAPYRGYPAPPPGAVDDAWNWYRKVMITEGSLAVPWEDARDSLMPDAESVWITDGEAVMKRDADSASGIILSHWMRADDWREGFPPPPP